MKNVIYNCALNILLFTLLGLAFMFPFSDFKQTEGGIEGAITIFPILLIVYLLVYPIIRYVIRKASKKEKIDDSELVFADEREKIIVSEATKTVYKVLIGGILVAIAMLGGIRFFTLFAHIDVSIYSIGILLLTVLLDAATVSYCIKWCHEYQK